MAGSSVTHSKCVCKIHQNTIPLLHAATIKDRYHELIKLLVWSSLTDRKCILRHCTSCPSTERLEKIIQEKFEDYKDEMQYQQEFSTDQIEIMRCTVRLDEFVAALI